MSVDSPAATIPEGRESAAAPRTGSPARRLLKAVVGLVATAWCVFGLVALLLVLIELFLERREAARPVTVPRLAQAFVATPPIELATFEDEFQAMCRPSALGWGAYACWHIKPRQGKYINVDADGLRRTWQPPAAPPAASRRKRIFVYGGSTAWGYGVRDDFTIPSWIARQLHESGHDVEVVNRAQVAYVSTQELIALEREIQRGNFADFVVFINGFNDVAATVYNTGPGLPMKEAAREVEFNLLKRSVPEIVSLALSRSAFLRSFGGALRGPVDAEEPPAQAGAPISGDELMLRTIRIYQKNLEIIQLLAGQYRFQPLFFWQPLITEKKSRAKEEADIPLDPLLGAACGRAYEDVKLGLARQNRLSLGPDLYYLGDMFSGPEFAEQYIFSDFCHLTEEGNRVVAKRVLAELAPRLQTAD